MAALRSVWSPLCSCLVVSWSGFFEKRRQARGLAVGAGKQPMVILPVRRMIVVRQTDRLLLGERPAFSDVEFLRLLLEQG